MPDFWPHLYVFARVSLFMTLCPVFFPTGSPRTLKAVSCLAFTLAMLPLARAAGPLPVFTGGKIAVLLREALLGAVMGSAVQLPFAALRAAGSLMDMQSGLSMAQIMDPASGQGQTALSSFMGMVSMLIFLSLDGHLWVLRGLSESFSRLPLAGPWPSAAGLGAWIELSGLVLSTAVQVSAPIIALLLLTELSLGLVSRIMPQLNLLILGQPVRFAAGLAGAAAVVALMPSLAGGLFSRFFAQWAALIGKL